jgi:hypothetical protein
MAGTVFAWGRIDPVFLHDLLRHARNDRWFAVIAAPVRSTEPVPAIRTMVARRLRGIEQVETAFPGQPFS